MVIIVDVDVGVVVEHSLIGYLCLHFGMSFDFTGRPPTKHQVLYGQTSFILVNYFENACCLINFYFNNKSSSWEIR